MINIITLWSNDLEDLTRSSYTHNYDYRVHAIQSALIIMFQHSTLLMSKLRNKRIEYNSLTFGFNGCETEELCEVFSKVFNCGAIYTKQFYETVFNVLLNNFGVGVFFSPVDKRIHIINILDINNDNILDEGDIRYSDFGDAHVHYNQYINTVDDWMSYTYYYHYSPNAYKTMELELRQWRDYKYLYGAFNVSSRGLIESPYMNKDGILFIPGGLMRMADGSVHSSKDDNVNLNIKRDETVDTILPPISYPSINSPLDDNTSLPSYGAGDNGNPSYDSSFEDNYDDNKNNSNGNIFDKPSNDKISNDLSYIYGGAGNPMWTSNDFVYGLANNRFNNISVSNEKDKSWSSTSSFPIKSISDLHFESSEKHIPFFRANENDISRQSGYDMTIVYGPNKQHYRKLIQVIPRAKSQEVDASGEAIYDIIEFIAKDVVEKIRK